MSDFFINLLAIRVFISFIGLIGNIFLLFSITQARMSPLKSFELFVLGLATSNMEEIIIVNIYEIVILQTSSTMAGSWACRLLKFLTVLGEITSILFTILISIFRYQKLRDASKRVQLPVYLDSIKEAWKASGVCVMFSVLVSAPIFVINVEGPEENLTRNGSGCPPDFFLCSEDFCPILNCFYKYLFIVVCNLLPLIIITISSCFIIMVLLRQRRAVGGIGHFGSNSKGLRLQRSTVAVLAAMALFQVDWTLHLVFYLMFNPCDFPLWAEMEFFISTSYTSISPYVYGIGSNLFSLKYFKKK